MKNQVSELMDGELANQDAKKIIEVLKKDNELHNDWETYHLIGDTLRQSSSLSTNLTQRVRQQLESEPIVFKPPRISGRNSKTKVFAFATAASVVAMVSAWLIMQNVYQQSAPITMADQSKLQAETDRSVTSMMISHPPRALSYPSHMPVYNMDNYLFFHNFHKEFSPGMTARNQSVYVYPVTDFHDQYGR